MLKNDIRYILKRVIVAVLIAFILFFLKSNHVLAATVTLSNNQFQYTRHLCNIGELNCTDYYGSGYSNYGTWLSMPSQPSLPNLTRYYLIATYSQSTATLQTGNVYTFIFRTQLNPKDNALDHVNSLQYNIYAKVNNTWSDNYISTQSCSTRNVVTHDYAIETTCVFQVNTNATGVLIRSVYRLTQTPTQLTLSNAQCFSSQSEVGAINELTNVLKQMSATIINNFTINMDKQYDFLTDNSDAAVDVSEMTGINTILPAGPVDSLLTLPITLIQILINNTSGTCTPFTFTFVFNEQFTLPCFDDFWNQVPNSMLLFLSDLPAVYIFIKWAKSVYKRVERATMFESSVDDEWGGV